MKKITLLIAAASLALALTSHASFQASFAAVNGSYYDLNATTGNADFQGTDLGIFDTTTDSILLGSEMNLTGGNIEYSRTGWAVKDNLGAIVGGSFTETAGSFDSVQSGNDRWVLSGASRPDLLSGLSNGDYTVEVYLHGKYNGGGNFFESNGGPNFIADFTVVPEPGAYALIAGLFGLSFVALRRRQA